MTEQVFYHEHVFGVKKQHSGMRHVLIWRCHCQPSGQNTRARFAYDAAQVAQV